ncbi:MAG: regulatory protein RecX [Cyclobacteriaceae bacterium]
MTREDYLQQAKSKAAKFCAYKERAPFEVKEKLSNWELTDHESESIIEYLVKEKFLDEKRFARAYCHDKFEFNKWGRVKIRMMISKYQLPSQVVDEALSCIDQEKYFQLILKLCEEKWAKLRRETDSFKKKSKAANYLLQKGFEADHCWAAVNQMS